MERLLPLLVVGREYCFALIQPGIAFRPPFLPAEHRDGEAEELVIVFGIRDRGIDRRPIVFGRALRLNIGPAEADPDALDMGIGPAAVELDQAGWVLCLVGR